MSKVSISVLIAAIIAISVALDCSRVVVKEQEGVLNWLGNITFTVPVATQDHWALTMFFDQNFTGVGVWNAYVSYDGYEKWAEIVNKEGEGNLQQGQKKSQRFRINYGVDIPQPKVTSMTFQDIELCQ